MIISSKQAQLCNILNQLIFREMSNKGYLSKHPEVYRKTSANSVIRQPVTIDTEELAQQFILEETEKIKEIKMRIKAYQVKIEEEGSAKLDYSEEIAELKREIALIRQQEDEILQQIHNCRQIENQVTPMEYYIWKKKQRINTYDASIAQLCRDIQRQRQHYEQSIDDMRRENQEIIAEIEEFEQKINNFGTSPHDSGAELQDEQEFEELFGKNITLKEEYSSLMSNTKMLAENREIVGMQVIDNIGSIQTTLRSFYEQQKSKLMREFKQIQTANKVAQISPLSKEEQVYQIDPLLADYAYKFKQLLNAAPEEVRKIVQPILQPLPWAQFNWREYSEINNHSEQIYNEYSKYETQYVENEGQVEKMKMQLRQINSDIANEQQKLNEISLSIVKLKKKLQK